MDIVARLQGQIKDSLKSGDKPRTDILRLLLSAVKQDAIDSGNSVDDARFIAIVEKMIKQRRESIRHFETAQRQDLINQEQSELDYLETLMPAAMSNDELAAVIEAAVQECGAQSIKDMGKVMAQVKPQVAGKADMSKVSALIKQKLSG